MPIITTVVPNFVNPPTIACLPAREREQTSQEVLDALALLVDQHHGGNSLTGLSNLGINGQGHIRPSL